MEKDTQLHIEKILKQKIDTMNIFFDEDTGVNIELKNGDRYAVQLDRGIYDPSMYCLIFKNGEQDVDLEDSFETALILVAEKYADDNYEAYSEICEIKDEVN